MSTTVAIVDDSPTLRKSMSQLINSVDALECIGTYGSVEEAVEGVRAHPPDVVLMDIGLPGVSGVEGTRRILREHPDIDVIMLTVYADPERIFESIRAGASGYMLKNADPARIIDGILDIRNGGSPLTASVARIVMSALREDAVQPLTDDRSPLTDREYEILVLIMEGRRYQQIADHLFISVDTVRSHIRRIYEKLQVHSKTEALAAARRRGLL